LTDITTTMVSILFVRAGPTANARRRSILLPFSCPPTPHLFLTNPTISRTPTSGALLATHTVFSWTTRCFWHVRPAETCLRHGMAGGAMSVVS